MEATNTVAAELEGHGVRTFSAKEMAFNILGLMHPLLFSITQVEPIWADLNGGMDRLPDLADITTRIRTDLAKKSELRRSIARDNAADFKVINGVEAERVLQTVNVTPRANFQFSFPTLEPAESLENISKLRGMLELEKVVVITGASRGIGRACAVETAKHGATGLVLHYFGDEATTKEVEILKQEIESTYTHAKAVVVPGDIALRETFKM